MSEMSAAPSATGAPSTHCSTRRVLRAIDFFINDLVVVGFSMSDIVLDVLVCIQFYRQQRMIYFYISVLIFIFAQLSYAFLFVATWGKKLRVRGKTLLFFLVLPLGQLVPFFTWIEAFRFEKLDAFLKYIGLEPTLDPTAAAAAEADARAASQDEEQGRRTTTTTDDNTTEGAAGRRAGAAAAPEGGDMLWGYIQSKYQSHAGFLAEALAEAIPQCVLQTIAVITMGQASPLFLVSILTSVTVIGSKGYLVSYSIHRPSFVFNFCCILADMFCLFALCAWLFDDSVSYSQKVVWVYLLVGGCALLVTGGLALVIFSMVDDHLKLLNVWPPRYDERASAWFDIYLVRLVAWIVAVVPVSVVFLTTKLSLVPILVFKSLDPEHAQRWQFYSQLYRFLSLNLNDWRLYIANRFFTDCHIHVAALQKAITRDVSIQLRVTRQEVMPTRIELEREELFSWVRGVGYEKPKPSVLLLQWQRDDEETRRRHSDFADILVAAPAIDHARAEARRTLWRRELDATFERPRRELVQRSAVFRIIFEGSGEDNPHEDLGCTGDLLVAVGAVVMIVGLLCFAALVPVFFVFVGYGAIFPLLQLAQKSFDPAQTGLLPYVLTISYIVIIAILIGLVPAIHSFHSVRIDLVDLKGFPSVFYETPTLRELHYRFNKSVCIYHLERMVNRRLGRDVLRQIQDFYGPEENYYATKGEFDR